MKKLVRQSRRWIHFICLGLVVFGGLFFLYIGIISYWTPSGFRFVENQSSAYITEHISGVQSILTSTMDAAERCSDTTAVCEQVNQRAIYAALGETNGVPYFPSTYFIRVKDHTIQKLFLSGRFVSERVNTLGELRTYFFLTNGKTERLICPDLGFRFLSATCLGDFTSFAGEEDIIRVRDGAREMGAVVKLYGS